jgi:transcription elongation factor GreB
VNSGSEDAELAALADGRWHKAAMSARTNYISPSGYRQLREEYEALFGVERPKLLETITWAAANGDRSENADYQYGRRRLREIDRRINFLARRMKEAQVIDASAQPDKGRIWFGATITIADEDDIELTLTLVGEDEAEASAGRISWNSPIARAVRGAAVGDVRKVRLPSGERDYEVLAIRYPD